MNIDQVATLLKVLTAYDGRNVGEADLMVWGRQFAEVDFADAVEAAHQHYGESSDWARPSDIRQRAEKIRNARNRRPEAIAPGCFEPDPEMRRRLAPSDHGLLALPGRFEPDDVRDERLRRGIAEVIKVLPPVDEAERIHQKAMRRARIERGPSAPPERHSRKPMRKGKLSAPATDEVAAIARRYLADGHDPADVSARFGIAKWWCDQTRREVRGRRGEWCGRCAYESRQRWKDGRMVDCPRCKPDVEENDDRQDGA
jgi:hypothetical protein